MLAWVAIALALEHAALAGAGARARAGEAAGAHLVQRLSQLQAELQTTGQRLLKDAQQRHKGGADPDKAEDLTALYHATVNFMDEKFGGIADMATNTRSQAEEAIKSVMAIKDTIESFMEQMSAQSELHLEQFESLSKQIEDLRATVEALQRQADGFNEDSKDLLRGVKSERDAAAYTMGDEMRYADEELDALQRDSKKEIKETRKDVKHDIEVVKDDSYEQLDDGIAAIQDEIEEGPKTDLELKRERDGMHESISTQSTALNSRVKTFEKDFDKTMRMNDKKLTKYGQKTEKTVPKMEQASEKSAARAEKEVAKLQSTFMREEDRKTQKQAGVEVRAWRAADKVYSKEKGYFEKDADKAKKHMARAAVQLAKAWMQMAGDDQALTDEVEGANTEIGLLREQFKSKEMDAKATFETDLSVDKKAQHDELKASAEQSHEQINSKYMQMQTYEGEQLARLRKQVVDNGGSKLTEAAKRASVVILAEIEDAAQEQLRAHAIAKEFKAESKSFDEETGGVEMQMSNAKLKVDTALKSMQNTAKREMSMTKEGFKALGKQFVTTVTKNLDVFNPKDITDAQEKAQEAAREVAAAMLEQLHAQKQTQKQVADLTLKQAQDIRNHAHAQDAAVGSLAAEDVAKILRAMQTAEKVVHAKVSGMDQKLDSAITQQEDSLKRAHLGLRGDVEAKQQSVMNNEKAFLEKIGITNSEELQHLFEKVKEADSDDQVTSNRVLGNQATLEEKIRGMAAQLSLNQETYDQVTHQSETAQAAEIGPQGLAKLRADIQAESAHQEGDFLAKEHKAYHEAKQEGRKHMDGEVERFGDKTQEISEDQIRKIRHAINMMNQLQSEAEHKSGGLAQKVEESGGEADDVNEMIQTLHAALQNSAMEVEKGAASSSKQMDRFVQQLLAEGKDGVKRENMRADSLLHQAKLRLEQQLQETLGHEIESKNIAMQSESMAALDPSMQAVEEEKSRLKQQLTQVDAIDGAMKTGLSDGLKRWEDREGDVAIQTNSFERKLIADKAKPPKAEGLEEGARVSEDRADAGIKVLGENTDSLSEKAGDDVTLAGGQTTSQAKAAGMGLELQLSGIEAQEQRAFQQQGQRDEALSAGVGGFLGDIKDTQNSAERSQADVQAEIVGIEELLKNEHKSLTDNLAFLKNYQQQAGEKVTEMLGNVVHAMEARLVKSNIGLANVAASQHTVEARVDQILGSAAYQQLAKLQRADDFSLEVLMDDEFVKDWMIEHNQSSAVWKNQVEAGFAHHEEAAALHAAEVKADDEENREHMKEFENMATKNLENMANSVASAADTGAIEQGVETSLDMFKQRQKASEELDDERVKGLLINQERLSTQMKAALANGKGELDKLKTTGGQSAAEFSSIQNLLGKITSQHDEEVKAKMKALQERQRKFDQQLLFATVGGGKTAPTEKEVQELLQQAEALSQQHEELSGKRALVGEKIGGLFTKLAQALEKAHTEKKKEEDGGDNAALVQTKGSEKQLRIG